MSTTFQAPEVSAVVKRGWRRRLLVLAVDQAALVLALVFGAFALLIVLGTQILAWQWLLAITAIGIGVAVFGVRRRLSDAYRVAQMMDEHLSLDDSLSTAWFLQTHTPGSTSAAAYQLSRAEELARTADPAAAFPFKRGRAWIVTAAMFALAFALFSARYLVTHDLSLEHSFLPMTFIQVVENIRHPEKTPDHKEEGGADQQLKGLPPASVGQDAERHTQTEKSEPGAKPNQQARGGAADAKSDQAPDQNSEQAKSADGQGGDQKRSGSGDASKNGSNPQANKQASNPGDQQDAKQQDASGSQQPNSMMDRMRDALSSVMAKIKPTGNNPNSQSQKNSEGQKSSDQAGNKDQAGDTQKDAGKEESAQEQSSGEQKGQGAAKAEAAQGKDSAQPGDKKGSNAQSGVGHSDGDKELRAAEQAKAMGKLAEIIGKRSASLTGDMQIEPSGKQRLQTDYTHQHGQHSDLGGEINRDEVPVEDQEYVREYMEMVRKKPARSSTKTSPPN